MSYLQPIIAYTLEISLHSRNYIIVYMHHNGNPKHFAYFHATKFHAKPTTPLPNKTTPSLKTHKIKTKNPAAITATGLKKSS
jgi:hypothetical protein